MTYLTTRDVAALLVVSVETVRQEALSGRLPCSREVCRHGTRVYRYFSLDDVRQYLSVYDPALLPRVPREAA